MESAPTQRVRCSSSSQEARLGRLDTAATPILPRSARIIDDAFSSARIRACIAFRAVRHLSSPLITTMPNNSKPAVSSNGSHAEASAATDVYAVHGADPEVLAYGMAKYSRSALSLRESLAELNEQKAEKFLNTFYFQYGHRSIADL